MNNTIEIAAKKRQCNSFEYQNCSYIFQTGVDQPPYPCLLMEVEDDYVIRINLEPNKLIKINENNRYMLYNYTAFDCVFTKVL